MDSNLSRRIALVISAAALLLSRPAWAQIFSFDDAMIGQPPRGWTVALTGSGASRWTVERDDSAPSAPNVLKQSAVGTYPICFKDDVSLADGYVEVKFKTLAGREDQAAGVIWRARDKDNYYIARANALEDNVTIYHTIGGQRVSFGSARVRVTSNQWHRLRVDFSGNHFVVALDGTPVIDSSNSQLQGPGQVGLWTKADSVTLFDDFNAGAK